MPTNNDFTLQSNSLYGWCTDGLGCGFFLLFCCCFKAFFPCETDKCLLLLVLQDLGRVQPWSLIWFLWEKQNYIPGLTTVQFPNVTMVITYVTSLPLFTTAQFKIQVEYFHDYGRVIISLLKGRRFRR